MEAVEVAIAGVFEASTGPKIDSRGQFARLFCLSDLHPAHGQRRVVQINHSMTRTVGAIRGLHYQTAPAADAKWVRCIRGRVFDVAVDLRRGSPTFLQWHAVELDSVKMNAIFIPEGFAHGFQVLSPESELLYLHSAPYAPAHEGAVRFDDPRVAVKWPLPVTDLSERDRNHPLIGDNFAGLGG